MRVGVLGTVKMGSAIAQRLLEMGHEVTVWNRTPGRAAALEAAGAKVAATPRALAEASEAVLTALTDAAAIDAVLSGPDGVLAGDLGGRLVIETSTVQPHEQRDFADRVRKAGGRYVECAVSGTTGPARQGRLIGLAGGEADDVAAARPVLDQLCRRLEHCGPVGAGASIKLAVNLPLILYYQALGEAYALCRNVGRDPDWLIDLLADTSGGPNILKVRGAVIAAALKGDDPTSVSFDVDGLRKDLRTMLAEARTLGTSLPLVERALAVYDQASAEGWGAKDGNVLPRYWSSRGAG